MDWGLVRSLLDGRMVSCVNVMFELAGPLDVCEVEGQDVLEVMEELVDSFLLLRVQVTAHLVVCEGVVVIGFSR